jgi:hypothetical protein
MAEDAVLCDFVCLCCGARNGERIPTCSFNKYVKESGDITSEDFREGLVQWLASLDYKGALLIPTDYLLEDEYRLRIIEMTEPYRKAKKGIVLFGLPGVTLPGHAVSLTDFLN